MPSSSSRDWPSLLSSCRDARQRSSALTFEEIRDEFAVHYAAIVNVLQDYTKSLRIDEENAEQREDGVVEEDGDARTKTKELILSVRNALRFGISCMSLASPAGDASSCSSSVRSRIQEEAVIGYNLHKALAQILSCRGMDSKSRVLASRLLSNLVAANKVTSEAVARDIALSPTDSYKTRQLLNTMALADTIAPSSHQSLDNYIELNWVDMISAAARSGNDGRDALAAIVATLFNIMHATQERLGENGSVKIKAGGLPKLIASDETLMCAFMRHILPADTIKPCGTSSATDSGRDRTGTTISTVDDATEWISLLLTTISTFGHFPAMYEAVGVSGVSTVEDSSSDRIAAIITPEQIVLLHCIASSLDDWAGDTSAGAAACPLGGALGQQTIISSCKFLAQQVKVLKHSISDHTEAYEGEKDCRISAYLSILEMLATVLSSDDSNEARNHAFCRIYLGKETSLVSDTVVELGVLVDKLSVSNRGVKARELVIDSNDQRLAVVLVRLIGNICYKCVSNQDLVRETPVPFSDSIPAPVSDDGSVIFRSGLHVLLSCTSFSYGCFTLREWALVAIRNVLDDNKQNQEVVAQLEAQKTVDTPELNKLGVKTVIDEQGKVRVEPRS